MTQTTFETNGEGLPSFPMNMEVAPVSVYQHDSGMMATHDYSCPCCRENHAVLDLSTGIMNPCRVCEVDYKIVKIDKRLWWEKLFGIE